MNKHPCHKDELVRLKRIEGQIRGAQNMIDQGRYCVDILRTLNAAVGAIKKVEDQILKRHLAGCVTNAFQTSSEKARHQKLDEILNLVSDFRTY